LTKDKPLLNSEEEIKEIFSIVESLTSFHSNFLVELEQRVCVEWGPTKCIGDIFLRNNAFFKMTSIYVRSYILGVRTLEKSKQKK